MLVLRTGGHDGYIRAVVAALRRRGITVDAVTVGLDSASRIRRAAMTVALADPLTLAWAEADWVRLRWDERAGWYWQVRYPEDPHPRGPVYFGHTQIPRPGPVANWVLISLAYPGIGTDVQSSGWTTRPKTRGSGPVQAIAGSHGPGEALTGNVIQQPTEVAISFEQGDTVGAAAPAAQAGQPITRGSALVVPDSARRLRLTRSGQQAGGTPTARPPGHNQRGRARR